ncbi:MAG TPA: hypothetical protein VHU83_15535 [Bryobacteraceae bacterium]|nr:hypothetical protein [Bryobacteraceae bacterium]
MTEHNSVAQLAHMLQELLLVGGQLHTGSGMLDFQQCANEIDNILRMAVFELLFQ